MADASSSFVSSLPSSQRMEPLLFSSRPGYSSDDSDETSDGSVRLDDLEAWLYDASWDEENDTTCETDGPMPIKLQRSDHSSVCPNSYRCSLVDFASESYSSWGSEETEVTSNKSSSVCSCCAGGKKAMIGSSSSHTASTAGTDGSHHSTSSSSSSSYFFYDKNELHVTRLLSSSSSSSSSSADTTSSEMLQEFFEEYCHFNHGDYQPNNNNNNNTICEGPRDSSAPPQDNSRMTSRDASRPSDETGHETESLVDTTATGTHTASSLRWHDPHPLETIAPNHPATPTRTKPSFHRRLGESVSSISSSSSIQSETNYFSSSSSSSSSRIVCVL